MKTASEQQACKFAAVLVEHFRLLMSAPATALQWAVMNPKEAIAVCIQAITAEAKKFAETVKIQLKVWKTITLGGIETDAILKAIEGPDEASGKEKNEVGSYARDLTAKPDYQKALIAKPEKADLVILTVADLGFTEPPRTDAFLTKEFCAEWSRKHLDGYVIELCSPEVGPQLRLQYQDQPKGEVLWIAMERITDSDGHPYVFSVGRHDDGRRWLSSDWTHPNARWDLDARIVFRLRKISSQN